MMTIGEPALAHLGTDEAAVEEEHFGGIFLARTMVISVELGGATKVALRRQIEL